MTKYKGDLQLRAKQNITLSCQQQLHKKWGQTCQIKFVCFLMVKNPTKTRHRLKGDYSIEPCSHNAADKCISKFLIRLHQTALGIINQKPLAACVSPFD